MKKILFFLLFIPVIMTSCSQVKTPNATNNPNTSQIQTVSGTSIQDAQSGIDMDWLLDQLTKNFAEIKMSLGEIDFTELGYPETKVLGFSSSGVSVIIFDKNHEVYGNTEEFEDAISRYRRDENYYEDNLNPEISIQFTKSAVMGNNGNMKKEYFYSLPDGEMLKVRVSFPADQEVAKSTEKERIQKKISEIEEVLLSNLVFIRNPELEFSYGPCDNTVDPFKQSDLGIKETLWVKDDAVQIKSFESLNCGEIIHSVGYTNMGKEIVLQYLSPRCGGDTPCAKCMCAHELIYKINNIEKGEYQFRLERQY